MAFKSFNGDSRQGAFQRQMFDVSAMKITCKDCGAPITQLPFNPDPNRLDSIRCQDCMRKWRENRPKRRF